MSGSNYQKCFATAAKAAGRDLSNDELDKLFTKSQARMAYYQREGLSAREAATRAGKELGDEATMAAQIEAIQKKNNLLIQRNLQARTVAGREADSAIALVTGLEKSGDGGLFHNKGSNFENAALSVDALGHARVADVLGPMTAELGNAGLLKPLMKGDRQFDRDVANEMGRLNDPNFGKSTGNKFAAHIAQILQKYQERVRVMQNDAGAFIGKLEQYITRQSHDAEKILAAGFDKWRDVILPKLDEYTFRDQATPQDRNNFLHEIYMALATGAHEGATGADWLGGFKGPQNLAAKVSEERKLFFKSADDWVDYNTQFGHGSVAASIFHQIEHGARNAAMMEMLGSNPEAMFQGYVNKLIRQAKDRGDVDQVARLNRESGTNSDILAYAMKKSMGSSVPTFTKIMAATRSIQDFKLSGFLSYISDLQTMSSVMRHNGVSMLDSYVNQLKGLLPQGAEAHEAALQLGQGADGFTSSYFSRMRAYDGTVRGKLAAAAATFEKWNGVKWWVQSQKEAAGRMFSGNLARNVGKEYEELAPLLQTTLKRYGIQKAEWDTVRQTAVSTIGGHDYLFPQDVADRSIANKLSTYINDQVRVGMSEPTAGITRSIRGPMQPATYQSEIMRSIFQFKTFPAVHVMRSLTREMFRNGFDAPGVAKLIAGTGLLGYVSYSLKKGTRAQIPAPLTADGSLSQNPGDYGRAFLAGMAQGGGLGLYGDFLFGEKARTGGSIAEEFAGPAASSIGQILTTIVGDAQRAAKGEAPSKGWGRELASQGIQTLKQTAPGINLWYARAALDYGILYSLQETINPGYLRRYENQMKKDQGTNFILSPTQDHLHTFGK